MSENAATNPHPEADVSTQDEAMINDSSKQIPTREKIAYGFGDFGNGFMFDLGQAYLTKFWIDACGIGAGAVAGIFAFTKIFDAFMDPIAGSVIDNRKKIGKQGKFPTRHDDFCNYLRDHDGGHVHHAKWLEWNAEDHLCLCSLHDLGTGLLVYQ